jgi:diguanylate cyclase
MIFAVGSTLPNVMIDVALGFTAFFAGFFSALTYFRCTAAKVAPPASTPTPEPVAEAAANDAARANMAVQQLRDLAQNVASDVGAHNTLVGNISDQLGALKDGGGAGGEAVREAVTKMLEANNKLQSRLEDAERKIQAQAEEIRTQQSEARTDALTKLSNRRAFDACLTECLEKFQADARPFSMLIFDVDHFKQFNDTHGHLAGDEVLRHVGRTLAKTVKSGDVPCRYGGEEFAIIMTNTAAAEAQVAAERIRRAIESMAVQFSGKTLRVTASIGMAECATGEEAAQLVRRADDSVYASKKAGRNCSHWHNGIESIPINPPGKQPAPKAAEPVVPARINLPTLANAALPDRAVFSDHLRRRIAECHRSGEPLSVLHFRVKDFEKLETTYGTAVGALLLDSLATFIASTLRDMDMLGKLEAGEFVVMLPGSSSSAARIVGQRVKASISQCPVVFGSQQVRLDLDLGCTGVQADDDAPRALARAKKAMELSLEAPAAETSAKAPSVEPVPKAPVAEAASAG